MKLFIGNLLYDIADSELQNLFGQHGDAVGIDLSKDQYSRQTKRISVCGTVNTWGRRAQGNANSE